MPERGDKVYTQIVKNSSVSELLPIVKDKADTDAVIYSDGFKTYDGLVNYGYKNIIASSMARMNLPMNITILVESRTSGKVPWCT